MKFTYYGHSSWLIEFGGKKLLTDPFITPNELAANIQVDQIEADYILLSHAHGDHVADLESIAKRTGAKIISSFEAVTYYEGKGLTGHPMNIGGKWKFDFGTVKCVTAVHSSVFPDGTYGSNPMGFVVWNDRECFYFAGDTALTMDMQLLPMICPKLDVAILPIGDNFTMGLKDAVIAADFIKCNRILGCHYDTFGYIEIDHDTARQAFAEKGMELNLLPVGKSFEI
jgi:L-ascorbate metabolism protein UlaG (beta-lactamase superfamily)